MTAKHRYVFLGPQGSGKGTQAEFLAHYLRIPHISTGELFRAAVAKRTPLGQRISAALSSGKLMSDDDTNAVVAERISQPDAGQGYILDGYPRTMAQVTFLEKLAAPSLIILLELPDKEAVRRLGGRRICRLCGTMYHLEYQSPREVNHCDHCGGNLERRQDDEEVAIRERLRLYHLATEPLVEFYAKSGRLLRVDGHPSIPDVSANLKRALNLTS